MALLNPLYFGPHLSVIVRDGKPAVAREGEASYLYHEPLMHWHKRTCLLLFIFPTITIQLWFDPTPSGRTPYKVDRTVKNASQLRFGSVRDGPLLRPSLQQLPRIQKQNRIKKIHNEKNHSEFETSTFIAKHPYVYYPGKRNNGSL